MLMPLRALYRFLLDKTFAELGATNDCVNALAGFVSISTSGAVQQCLASCSCVNALAGFVSISTIFAVTSGFVSIICVNALAGFVSISTKMIRALLAFALGVLMPLRALYRFLRLNMEKKILKLAVLMPLRALYRFLRNPKLVSWSTSTVC